MLESIITPEANPAAGPLLFTTGIEAAQRPLNVVCIGAHPDDPETGCGGTLAKLADQGHRITILYLTRGEAGIKEGDVTDMQPEFAVRPKRGTLAVSYGQKPLSAVR